MQLDKPDPDIDRIWAKEARKRWQAYRAEKMHGYLERDVMLLTFVIHLPYN